ncbi:hypothetical protein HZS_5656 [Henneguya salminicola]|nr:hypothetical protein HZS_5656 [Henneguya salminicola]
MSLFCRDLHDEYFDSLYLSEIGWSRTIVEIDESVITIETDFEKLNEYSAKCKEKPMEAKYFLWRALTTAENKHYLKGSQGKSKQDRGSFYRVDGLMLTLKIMKSYTTPLFKNKHMMTPQIENSQNEMRI